MSANSGEMKNSILGAVRRNLHRGPLSEGRKAELASRLRERPRGPRPERSQGSRAELVERFVSMAEEASSTVQVLSDVDAVPEALGRYLQDHNLPAQLRIAPDPALRDLDWAGRVPMIEVSEGLGEGSTMVGLVQGMAGVAETGTLYVTSGPENPTSLNFLPDSHVVLLKTSQVQGSYEDVWALLRERQKAAGKDLLPRTVNMITGPSRTGDIEQILQLGAHGPRRLHILLVDDEGVSGGPAGEASAAQPTDGRA